MKKHGGVIHPVNSGKHKGGIIHAIPVKGGGARPRQTNTANNSRAPVRAGMGATASKDWYRRND